MVVDILLYTDLSAIVIVKQCFLFHVLWCSILCVLNSQTRAEGSPIKNSMSGGDSVTLEDQSAMAETISQSSSQDYSVVEEGGEDEEEEGNKTDDPAALLSKLKE
mgnify:CR=1 FL=1